MEKLFDGQKNSLIAGINDEAMQKTILDIFTDAEKIKTHFGNIEVLLDNLNDCLDSENTSKIMDLFNHFKTNFAIIEANIQNYGNDLNKVRHNFQKISMEAVDYLKSDN